MRKMTGRIVFEPTGEFRPPVFRDWFLTNETDPKPLCAGADWVGERRHILRVAENTLREAPEPRKLTFGEACKLAAERPGVWVASRESSYFMQYDHNINKIRFGTRDDRGVITPSQISHINKGDIAEPLTEIIDEPEPKPPEPDHLIFEKVPGGCVAGEPCMDQHGNVYRMLVVRPQSNWTRLRIVRDFNKTEVPNGK